jgi:hypothetical protein
VNFKIVAPFIPSRLKLEYQNFKRDSLENVDFVITLKEFTPDLTDCTVIDHTYYIKNNYFYCSDSYKFGKWKIEVIGMDSNPLCIMVSPNFVAKQASDMFICAFIIDFFIRFFLNEKGYSVAHASSVEKEGKGYLFPSQSGAGKTTTAVYFVNAGYNYIGDDFTIFKDGILYNYLTPLNLFSYNLNPQILKNMTYFDRILIDVKDLLYRLTSGYVKIFSKMNPLVICGDNVGDEVSLKKVLLLSQQEDLSIKNISKDDVVNNIFINQKLESFPFYKYFLEYSYVYPESRIASYWERCLNDIQKNLVDGIEYIELGIPKKYL